MLTIHERPNDLDCPVCGTEIAVAHIDVKHGTARIVHRPGTEEYFDEPLRVDSELKLRAVNLPDCTVPYAVYDFITRYQWEGCPSCLLDRVKFCMWKECDRTITIFHMHTTPNEFCTMTLPEEAVTVPPTERSQERA